MEKLLVAPSKFHIPLFVSIEKITKTPLCTIELHIENSIIGSSFFCKHSDEEAYAQSNRNHCEGSFVFYNSKHPIHGAKCNII